MFSKGALCLPFIVDSQGQGLHLLRLVLPEVRAVFSFRLGFPKTELYLTQAVAFGEQG